MEQVRQMYKCFRLVWYYNHRKYKCDDYRYTYSMFLHCLRIIGGKHMAYLKDKKNIINTFKTNIRH